MRSARLREILGDLAPTDAAWLLDSLATVGRSGGPPFDVGLLAAVDLASGNDLPYALRRSVFEAADAQGLVACKELLLSPAEVAAASIDAAAPRPIIPGTRPLTLGERKALARSWRRDVLERLLLDPHTDVIELVLANPHVTETDILKIATSRQSSAQALALVLRAGRWGLSPRVRMALVRNPNLPLTSALRLLGLLNRADLQTLARDPSVPPLIQSALERRLRPLS